MTNGSDRPYEVGKGKPPVSTRFKAGVSGNPTGAKRGAKTDGRVTLRDLAIQSANETITVTVRGRSQKLTKKEALILAVLNDALTGTPAHRLKASRYLASIGTFDVRASDPSAADAEARRKFLERLAEEARRHGSI